MKSLIRLLLEEQSDLGLHCLPKPVCPKTLDHYGIGLRGKAAVVFPTGCPCSVGLISELGKGWMKSHKSPPFLVVLND